MDNSKGLNEIQNKLSSQQEKVDRQVRRLQQKRILQKKREKELQVLKEIAQSHFKKLQKAHQKEIDRLKEMHADDNANLRKIISHRSTLISQQYADPPSDSTNVNTEEQKHNKKNTQRHKQTEENMNSFDNHMVNGIKAKTNNESEYDERKQVVMQTSQFTSISELTGVIASLLSKETLAKLREAKKEFKRNTIKVGRSKNMEERVTMEIPETVQKVQSIENSYREGSCTGCRDSFGSSSQKDYPLKPLKPEATKMFRRNNMSPIYTKSASLKSFSRSSFNNSVLTSISSVRNKTNNQTDDSINKEKQRKQHKGGNKISKHESYKGHKTNSRKHNMVSDWIYKSMNKGCDRKISNNMSNDIEIKPCRKSNKSYNNVKRKL